MTEPFSLGPLTGKDLRELADEILVTLVTFGGPTMLEWRDGELWVIPVAPI